MAKQIRFNAFDMNAAMHNPHGLWKHPDNERHRYKDLRYWVELAQLLERGLFDALFLADVYGFYDVFRGSRDAALRDAVQAPINDPALIIPTMAYATRHLGFSVTVPTTYEHPYAHARRMTTLDHLTNGRIGWNVVTSFLPSAARNFGLNGMIGHDERYERAEEYMEVVYKLWEGSWADDAVVRDPAAGVYTDPLKVREIGHEGKHYRVPGPHLSEPSPQRTPVIYQAGASERGRAFPKRTGRARSSPMVTMAFGVMAGPSRQGSRPSPRGQDFGAAAGHMAPRASRSSRGGAVENLSGRCGNGLAKRRRGL